MVCQTEPDDWEEVPNEALIVAFANGDKASGRALLERLGPRLYGHAVRVLGEQSEAEDLVQETMLRLWKFAPEWRQGEAQVSTWAYRVLINLCTDRLRARVRKPQSSIDEINEPASAEPSAIDQMTVSERNKALQTALAELPDRQRQAVALRHLEGLSNPEIAEIMEIGVEAVESLTARGKRTLKAALMPRKAELGYGNG